jgi:hypothetical protein
MPYTAMIARDQPEPLLNLIHNDPRYGELPGRIDLD